MTSEIVTLSCYQILTLLILVLFGDSIFNVPFTRQTPFYQLSQDEKLTPSNKLVLFTILFVIRMGFLMIDFLIFKTKDEPTLQKKCK